MTLCKPADEFRRAGRTATTSTTNTNLAREVQTFDVSDGVHDGAMQHGDAEQQTCRPQAEDNFGLGQKMQAVLRDRPKRILVCPMRKAFHCEGVQHGEREEDVGPGS